MIEVQKQQGGDNSTNYQTQSMVINQGHSYSEIKEIAMDVYKANFLQLSQDAADLAIKRVEEFSDAFLEKLKNENERAFSELRQPRMQAALYEAQKQYAITGDKSLEELLIDILVQLACNPERNLQQIVLTESLSVAGKLTTEQMDVLTINFLFSKTKEILTNLDNLNQYLEEKIIPFLSEFPTESCYAHLEYVGCASFTIMPIIPIENIFQTECKGLFSKGFDERQFDFPSNFLMRCFHNPEKLQINALNSEVLQETLGKSSLSDDQKNKIKNLFNTSIMSPSEIKDYIIKIQPKTQHLFNLWANSKISKFKLTTVGIAIAQANFRRRTGNKLDLSIWVN